HGTQPQSSRKQATTLTRYQRDKSDLGNEANTLSDQRKSAFLRVEGSGATAAPEPEYLSECSPRDKPWDGHRAEADQIATIYESHSEFQHLGERVSLCSLRLGFAWSPDRQDPNAFTLKLREARFCRVRLCPICQWRRSLMWFARFQE